MNYSEFGPVVQEEMPFKCISYPGLPLISISKFNDFYLTFNRFPDPFGRPILAIFIHRLFEDFAQIFELADLIFKEKS